MKNDERLATLETEVRNVKIVIDRIETKIDNFAQVKADKCEVDDLKSKFDKINFQSLLILISIVGFLFAKIMNWI